MASEVQNLFDKLESRRSILSTCTDLYKTLTTQFNLLEQSINSRNETLDSKIQTLESKYQKTLDDLQNRENSIPDNISSVSSLIESQKKAALAEFEKPVSENPPLSEELTMLCRLMDHSGLLKLVVSRRKESTTLKTEMKNALAECIDPPRLVLDAVKEFLDQKAVARGSVADKRWACGMIVGGLFPPDELKERKNNTGPSFARAIVERAEKFVNDWREKSAASGSGEGVDGIGPAEASMLLQIVVGFGLMDKFEEEFYKKLVMEFAARRDMPKLAVPIFGDQIGDIIDELVKNGKEVEAVYFATEAGLTERFQPASLLKAYLRNSKKTATDLLKRSKYSSSATDEANTMEMNSIRSIIRCVEEFNLEEIFPVESLTKRLSVLEKSKADRKKGSSAGSRPPPNKRSHSDRGSRGGGPPPHRPAKMSRYSSPYPPFGRRNLASPVSGYNGPYNYPSHAYPSQTVYDTGLAASTYGPSYGGPHIAPTSDHITQQHYGIPSETAGGGAGVRLGVSYGGQMGYAAYDYGAATTATAAAPPTAAAAPPTYQPSSYTPQ